MIPRLLAVAALLIFGLRAESGYSAWLRYAAADDAVARDYRAALPAVVVALDSAAPVQSAREELIRGVRGMLGRTLRVESAVPGEPAIVLGTAASMRRAFPNWPAGEIAPDGYRMRWEERAGARHLLIVAGNDRGVLYGAFALLRKLGVGEPIAGLDEQQSPANPVRWINHWDNLDGSIERGYGGRSIFWENRRARPDARFRLRPSARVARHQRLLDQ
jgi:alpha-glucuronidase